MKISWGNLVLTSTKESISCYLQSADVRLQLVASRICVPAPLQDLIPKSRYRRGFFQLIYAVTQMIGSSLGYMTADLVGHTTRKRYEISSIQVLCATIPIYQLPKLPLPSMPLPASFSLKILSSSKNLACSIRLFLRSTKSTNSSILAILKANRK